jgi:hypothetical protein
MSEEHIIEYKYDDISYELIKPSSIRSLTADIEVDINLKVNEDEMQVMVTSQKLESIKAKKLSNKINQKFLKDLKPDYEDYKESNEKINEIIKMIISSKNDGLQDFIENKITKNPDKKIKILREKFGIIKYETKEIQKEYRNLKNIFQSRQKNKQAFEDNKIKNNNLIKYYKEVQEKSSKYVKELAEMEKLVNKLLVLPDTILKKLQNEENNVDCETFKNNLNILKCNIYDKMIPSQITLYLKTFTIDFLKIFHYVHIEDFYTKLCENQDEILSDFAAEMNQIGDYISKAGKAISADIEKLLNHFFPQLKNLVKNQWNNGRIDGIDELQKYLNGSTAAWDETEMIAKQKLLSNIIDKLGNDENIINFFRKKLIAGCNGLLNDLTLNQIKYQLFLNLQCFARKLIESHSENVLQTVLSDQFKDEEINELQEQYKMVDNINGILLGYDTFNDYDYQIYSFVESRLFTELFYIFDVDNKNELKLLASTQLRVLSKEKLRNLKQLLKEFSDEMFYETNFCKSLDIWIPKFAGLLEKFKQFEGVIIDLDRNLQNAPGPVEIHDHYNNSLK